MSTCEGECAERLKCSWRGFEDTSHQETEEQFPHTQDELLLEMAMAHSPFALTAIHDLYHARLYHYIRCRVGQPSTAEDLTSDVFVQFLDALRFGHSRPRSLGQWLFAVARHRVADYYRDRHTEVSTSERFIADRIASDQGDPVARLNKSLRHEALRAALQSLSTPQREVLALRFSADLTVRETARILGKSEGAVKVLQFRALNNLRSIVESMLS